NRRDAQPPTTWNGPGGRASPGAAWVGASGALLLGDVGRLLSLRALHDVELDGLALGQGAEPGALDGSVMDEDVFLARALDEPVPFGVVEPLHDSGFTHGSLPSCDAGGRRPRKRRENARPLRLERPRALTASPPDSTQNTNEAPPGASRCF